MNFFMFCFYYCICTIVLVITLCVVLRLVFKFRLNKLSKRVDDSLDYYFKHYFEINDDDLGK